MAQISTDGKCSTFALHLRKPNNAIWLHDYPECALWAPSFTVIVWHERAESWSTPNREGSEWLWSSLWIGSCSVYLWFIFPASDPGLAHDLAVQVQRCLKQTKTDCLYNNSLMDLRFRPRSVDLKGFASLTDSWDAACQSEQRLMDVWLQVGHPDQRWPVSPAHVHGCLLQ